MGCRGSQVHELLFRANRVRIERRGHGVRLCSIVNAKSGLCTEDCKFCAQSAHNNASASTYELMSDREIFHAAQDAERSGAIRLGIVTSGFALEDPDEVATVARAVERIRSETSILPCASLGNVDKKVLQALIDAGLTRYHCNLECAESFFSKICSTREWKGSVETIRTAKELGLSVCCGGIFGLGESPDQQVELLDTVRSLDVDSVPLNFLNPIAGTPLENTEPIEPLDCLKVIAVARLMMPDKEIRVCGGREHNLQELQSWLLIAGADSLMVGGYLTTSGRNVKDDLRMISQAGFEVISH